MRTARYSRRPIPTGPHTCPRPPRRPAGGIAGLDLRLPACRQPNEVERSLASVEGSQRLRTKHRSSADCAGEPNRSHRPSSSPSNGRPNQGAESRGMTRSRPLRTAFRRSRRGRCARRIVGRFHRLGVLAVVVGVSGHDCKRLATMSIPTTAVGRYQLVFGRRRADDVARVPGRLPRVHPRRLRLGPASVHRLVLAVRPGCSTSAVSTSSASPAPPSPAACAPSSGLPLTPKKKE